MTATYTYDPSGQQTAATGTSAAINPLRYTQGLLDDQTGWIKHGVRFQDTTTANWTAQDQLSQLLRPDAASRYAYVGGNPRNYIDPTGRDSIDEFAGDVGTYIELGTGIGITVGGIHGGITGGIAGAAAGGVGAVPGAAAGATAGAGVGAAEGAAVGTIYGLGKAIYDRL